MKSRGAWIFTYVSVWLISPPEKVATKRPPDRESDTYQRIWFLLPKKAKAQLIPDGLLQSANANG